MPQLPCLLALSLAPATGVRQAGFGGTAALNVASQKWTITPDRAVFGVAPASKLYKVEANVPSTAGAGAREILHSWQGGALVLECIDPATGMPADAAGDLVVTVHRIPLV